MTSFPLFLLSFLTSPGIAHIGYRNDNPITIPEIEELLHDHGHLREIHIVKDITAEHGYINYGTVNFTFYGDFANAVAVSKFPSFSTLY